jgi:GGDEF domain-containing protein
MQISRASDTFGRLAGDEFLYIIDRAVSYETAVLACDRLVNSLQFAVDLEAVGLSLSATIGAAVFPTDGNAPEQLIATAQRALQTAKKTAQRYCVARDGGALEVTEDAMPAQIDAVAAPAAETQPQAAERRAENRRSEHRNRVFKRGRIIFGDGFSTMDCVVRDLSLHGARISMEDQIALPQRFSFSILDSGTTYRAVRRWQRGTAIGIEFAEELTRAGAKQALETQTAQ